MEKIQVYLPSNKIIQGQWVFRLSQLVGLLSLWGIYCTKQIPQRGLDTMLFVLKVDVSRFPSYSICFLIRTLDSRWLGLLQYIVRCSHVSLLSSLSLLRIVSLTTPLASTVCNVLWLCFNHGWHQQTSWLLIHLFVLFCTYPCFLLIFNLSTLFTYS